jgi:ribonuclease Z
LIERAEQFTGEALVLVHRSMRHTRSEAETLVQRRFPAAMRDRVHVFGR